MLFDYRKQTKIVSLEGLISWLETKNSEEAYNFGDCKGMCLFSQYLQERLGLEPKFPTRHDERVFEAWVELHNKFRQVADSKDHETFGEALARARTLQARMYVA